MSESDCSQRRPILYAEDEENDAFFMRRAFASAQVSHPLVVTTDGVLTIEYLEAAVQRAESDPGAIPCLVLLDLNMPFRSGFEVLEWMRSRAELRTIPVIVFSSSAQPQDKQRAYELGANAYLVKPSSPARLPEVLQSIKNFWLELNQFAPVVGAPVEM